MNIKIGYNETTEAVEYGFWEWDRKKDVISYSGDFLKSMNIISKYLDDKKEIKNAYKNAKKNNKMKFSIEKRVRCKNSKIIILEYRGKIEDGTDGKEIVHGICLNKDIDRDLRRNLEIKNKALSNSLAGIAISDLEGKIIYINRAFLNLWEFDDEYEVIGKHVSEFWANPQKAQEVAECILKIGMSKGELEAITNNGNTKKMEYYASSINDDNGNPLYMTSWFMDISKEKEMQRNYESIIREAPIGIFRTTLTGKIKLVNPALIEMLNCKNEEEVYKHYRDLAQDLYYYPFRRKEFISKIEKYGKVENFEYRCKDKFGKTKWLTMTCKKKNVDGEDILEGFVLDTTNLKKAEERYRDILDNAPIGILNTTLGGKILTVNAEVLKVLGYKNEEEFNKKSKNIKDIYVNNRKREKLVEKLKNQGEVKEFTARYRQKNGEIIWGSLSSKLIEDNKSNLRIINTFIKNITKQKEYEEKLRKARLRAERQAKTKDKFLSLIGHDLKNILSSSKMLSDYMVENFEKLDADELQKMINMGDRSFKQALDFLNNLLIWGRSQIRDIKLQKEEFKINEVIENVITVYDIKFKNKDIIFYNEIPQDMKIYTDKNMLETIIRNIISNSLKFTKNGGFIKITGEKLKSKLRISIEDNGIGMSKERAKDIFELEKSNSTLGTQKEKGTGLGLKIVKEFIDRNDGKIWVESKKGEGSKFIFEI